MRYLQANSEMIVARYSGSTDRHVFYQPSIGSDAITEKYDISIEQEFWLMAIGKEIPWI
jgi:hypothetical protein